MGANNANGSARRRTVLKAAVGAGAVAGAGVGGVLLTTRNEPVVAASGITASDVDIDSEDGTVSELTINPEPTVEWEHLEEPVGNVMVEYSAGISGGRIRAIGRHQDSSMSGKSGSVTLPPGGPWDLIEESSEISSSDFEDTEEDGVPEETDVVLQFRANLDEDEAGAPHTDVTETVTFTVSVNNLEGSATVSGPAHTDGS
jgi:hypothetical protein